MDNIDRALRDDCHDFLRRGGGYGYDCYDRPNPEHLRGIAVAVIVANYCDSPAMICYDSNRPTHTQFVVSYC
ncbi:hypothetical protein GCM10007897_29880 [Sphingobium jiangsuense]|nr:hypothetical protein GCM10007897_29880 [Sphingobium jiangsuense]